MMPSKGAVALRHSSSLQRDSDAEDEAQYDGDNESRDPSPTSSKSDKNSHTKHKDAADEESNANKTSEADGEEFEVDQVLDMTINMKLQCPIQFKVRWVGFKEEDDTWEDMLDLNCQSKIDEYIEETGQELKYKRAMKKYERMQTLNSEKKPTRTHLRRSAHDDYQESDEDSEKEFKCKKTRTRKIHRPDVFDVKVADMVQKSSVVKNRNSTSKSKPVIGMIVEHEDLAGGKKQFRCRYRGLHSSEDNWFKGNALDPELIDEYWSKVLPLDKIIEDDQDYEVESIVDSREEQGEVYYKVRWRGFKAKDDTWLLRKDMNCPKIIERFENILQSLSEREEWVVEKIMGERGEGEEKEYLVRWQGFGPKGDTWEPEANLLGCQDKLKNWADNQGEDSASEKEDSVISARPLKKRIFSDKAEDTPPEMKGSTRKTKRTPYRKHDELEEEAAVEDEEVVNETEYNIKSRKRGRQAKEDDIEGDKEEDYVVNGQPSNVKVKKRGRAAKEDAIEGDKEEEEFVNGHESNVKGKKRGRAAKEDAIEGDKEDEEVVNGQESNIVAKKRGRGAKDDIIEERYNDGVANEKELNFEAKKRGRVAKEDIGDEQEDEVVVNEKESNVKAKKRGRFVKEDSAEEEEEEEEVVKPSKPKRKSKGSTEEASEGIAGRKRVRRSNSSKVYYGGASDEE